MDLLRNNKSDAYSYNMVDLATDVQLHEKIDQQRIQGFTDRFRIACRSLTGSRYLAPANLEEVEMNVAAHLGKISGKLSFRLWDEQGVENADETHFLINVYNRKTL